MNIKQSKASKQAKKKLVVSLLGASEYRPDESSSGEEKGYNDGGGPNGRRKKKAKVDRLSNAASLTQEYDDGLRDGTGADSNRNHLVIPVPAPRNNDSSAFKSSSHVDTNFDNSGKKLPLLMANVPPELLEMRLDDSKKFKLDMSLRPTEASASSKMYESVPVEKFGAALLRGMGWSGPVADEETNNNDKNTNQLGRGGGKTILGLGDDVYRERRLGLGATAKPKPKETLSNTSSERWKEMVAQKVCKQKIVNGDIVMIREGELAGRKAKVSQTDGVPGLDQITVIMEASGAIVNIGRTQVTLVSSNFIGSSNLDADTKVSKSSSNKRRREIDDGSGNEMMKSQGARITKQSSHSETTKFWLMEGIRVRVISKTDAHLKKGVVLKVRNSKEASVQLDHSGGLKIVMQRELETVLPSVGKECLVLCGPHRGQKALLIEKNKAEESVLVQVDGSNDDTISLPMDYVAAYEVPS